jgi:hypothetical protein
MSAEDWTPECVDLLKRMRAQGYSAAKIAGALNAVHGTQFSRNAVIGKLIRIGAEPPEHLRRERKRQSISEASRLQHARKRGGAPPTKSEPVRTKAPPTSGGSVRFIDCQSNQCQMFCAGEEGANGLVCGAPVSRGRWCASCAKLVYTAVQAA